MSMIEDDRAPKNEPWDPEGHRIKTIAEVISMYRRHNRESDCYWCNPELNTLWGPAADCPRPR